MQNEPQDVSREDIAAALRRAWGLDVVCLEYEPVGFGSYHWRAECREGGRWFVTLDSLTERRQPQDAVLTNLRAAYDTAFSLKESGLSFVLAPVPSHAGQIIEPLGPDWVMAVFPFVSGEAPGDGSWSGDATQTEAARLIGRLHSTSPPPSIRPWEPEVAGWPSMFDGLSEPWSGGLFGEAARDLLIRCRVGIEALYDRFRRQVGKIEADDGPLVVSHGEPHSRNFIATEDGRLFLIDWDTVRLAPPERDLEMLFAAKNPDAVAAYQAAAGPRPVREYALEAFRARWALDDIVSFAARLRGPHGDTPDDQKTFRGLQHYLPIEKHWPEL